MTWSGAGDDSNWSNPNNWVGGVPTATDTAYFDDGCLACDVAVDQASSVAGVIVQSTFNGSITFNNDIALQSQLIVGNAGFSFAQGTL